MAIRKPRASKTKGNVAVIQEEQGQLSECSVHGKPVLLLAKVIELSREKDLRCPMCGEKV